MKSKTKPIIAVTVLIILVCMSIRPVFIKYHLRGVDICLQKITLYNRNGDPRHSTYSGKYEAHRDALVRLGYLEHKIVPLNHVQVPSTESLALWQELRTAFQTEFSMMSGITPGFPDEILIWDRPDNITRLEEIINKHDKPRTNAKSPH